MKTRGIVLPGLGLAEVGTVEHGAQLRLSKDDPLVDSRVVTEGKDVAGMAE
jgi:hypothetical protein